MIESDNKDPEDVTAVDVDCTEEEQVQEKKLDNKASKDTLVQENDDMTASEASQNDKPRTEEVIDTTRGQSTGDRKQYRRFTITTARHHGEGEISHKEHTIEVPKQKRAFYYYSHVREEHMIAHKYGEDSWQYKLLLFVYHPKTQMFLVALLVIDVIAIVTELIIDAMYPLCPHVLEISYCADLYPNSTALDFQIFAKNDDLDKPPESEVCAPECISYPDWIYILSSALHYTSITILSIFLLELFLLIMIMQKWFFQNWLYVLDLFIVSVSIVVEVLFHAWKDSAVSAEAVIPLVFVRAWRFVRIGHGLLFPSYEHDHEIMDKLELKIRELQIEVEAMRVSHKNAVEQIPRRAYSMPDLDAEIPAVLE